MEVKKYEFDKDATTKKKKKKKKKKKTIHFIPSQEWIQISLIYGSQEILVR